MTKLLVVIVHGIGSQTKNFADPCIEILSQRLQKQGKNSADVKWLPIHWASVTEPSQQQYLQRANTSAELNWNSLRKFVMSGLGDASAYQKVFVGENRTYEKIHEILDTKLSEFVSLHQGDVDEQLPVVFLAHSLGGHIMSNYIWDKQKKPEMGKSAIENMETVSGIITFGCNIPLFTFSYSPIIPITFPPVTLPDTLAEKAKWLNFYSANDILAYPLKCINDQYNKVVSEDIELNVGNILQSWNPFSHGEYWTDKDFTSPVANYLASFL